MDPDALTLSEKQTRALLRTMKNLTKKEYAAAGGDANPDLYRRQRGGRWQYFSTK